MLLKRKEFIQIGSLLTTSALLPEFLKAFESREAVPAGNKVVVVLQLSGGNDGLNTVVPFQNDLYYKARPQLSIPAAQAIRLNDDAALHPALGAFRQLYEDGGLGIINSVGYPNPDRSHFRSMDIWHSASSSEQYWNSGWVGRYLDAQCQSCNRPTQAIEIDEMLSLALKGREINGLAVKDPRRLHQTANDPFFTSLRTQHHSADHNLQVEYLYKTLAETLSAADYIFQQSKLRPSRTPYPATELGRNLKTIASLIFSDINTKVYYVSLGSFDTHINQAGQQQRLLAEMNDAVGAFVQDLKSNRRFEDVLLFTFSEFGRRVQQNASNGTDHGTANNMLLVSGALQQKGLINPMSDLSDLQDGDLQYKVDFKEVYATILKKWLHADDRKILGQAYATLNFI